MEKEKTKYNDKNGRRVCVGDWICFLFWHTCSDGTQREKYIYGRILKRRGQLVFRYKVSFEKGKQRFSERRLNTLNFDSTNDWEITNDTITHYACYFPSNRYSNATSNTIC